tara:strand:+ start:49 stop:621 length:573 start_codon:yes stop_codon:yes gene_type:complete
MKNNKFILIFLFFLLASCQKVEILDNAVFDYNQLSKILLSADKKEFFDLYEPKYADPYIDHSLLNPPKEPLIQWIENNFNVLGAENKLVINIFDSSLKKSEIPNIDLKKYKEKTIFLFEINYLVEFVLYDDSNYVLASAVVESKRSTTSGKYISLHETEKIIDNMIFDCLVDFSTKAEELVKLHMKDFIL